MKKEEKLEKYREFILMMQDFLKSGHVKISTCRVVFDIAFRELLEDAQIAKYENVERNDICFSIMRPKYPKCDECVYSDYGSDKTYENLCLRCRNPKMDRNTNDIRFGQWLYNKFHDDISGVTQILFFTEDVDKAWKEFLKMYRGKERVNKEKLLTEWRND